MITMKAKKMYKNKNKNTRDKAKATQPANAKRTVYYEELDELQLERWSAARPILGLFPDTPHNRLQYWRLHLLLWESSWQYRSYLNNLDFYWGEKKMKLPIPEDTPAVPDYRSPKREGLWPGQDPGE
jgi:hypothetical protein